MSSGQKVSGDFKIRQKVGKYKIERRLGSGGFAAVFQALDTVQGIRVAINIPHARHTTEAVLSEFRKEIRATSKLEHENILPIKDASIIDDRLVVVFPLGEETLLQRMSRRLSTETAFEIVEQILMATAEAHKFLVIHCDIKPENIIMFPGNRVRLADFGIAKVSQNTVQGGGTGTVGYMAPEQAMGKPSFRSDVFSIGLIDWRLLAGEWPAWPFDWPAKGYSKLRGRIHQDFIDFMRRAIDVNPRHRFRDAQQMLEAFVKLKYRTLRHATARRKAA